MDRFTNWEKIGSGGHANVYRAFDTVLGREVAIKVLNASAGRNTDLIAGLRREILISRDVRHNRICAIHDVYEGERGVGIVMDLINGTDTKAWIVKNKGNLTATATDRLQFLIHTTEALAALASHNIIHRDLKPSNIFLTDGIITNPLIMDFGISIAVSTEGAANIGGTPVYMAPEQYEAPAKVDARSDLFALGVMAYELFTDEIPPTSLRDIQRTKTVPRPRPEDIPLPSAFCPVLPPDMDQLILSLMAYEQVARPATAKEVLAALTNVKLLTQKDAISNTAIAKRVLINGGSYYLGSEATGPMANEKPHRRVILPSFLIDAHPVTNAAYRAFAHVNGKPSAPMANDPIFGRNNHPVVGLSWNEACTYAAWVGGRLPTETEWECAARGGTQFAEYPWGTEPPTATQANINMVNKVTTPVTAYPTGRNPLGLWDMCGNVWEWCADAFDPEFYGRLNHEDEAPRNDAKTDDARRSLRGGSFSSTDNTGRCAFRSHAAPTEKRRDVGFRVVYKL